MEEDAVRAGVTDAKRRGAEKKIANRLVVSGQLSLATRHE